MWVYLLTLLLRVIGLIFMGLAWNLLVPILAVIALGTTSPSRFLLSGIQPKWRSPVRLMVELVFAIVATISISVELGWGFAIGWIALMVLVTISPIFELHPSR